MDADSTPEALSHVGLGDLLLLLLAAGAPVPVRLSDNWPLHRALTEVDSHGPMAALLPVIGHQPDPLVGRRVTGLDAALSELARAGALTASSGGGWRPPTVVLRHGRRALAALPPSVRPAVEELAQRWYALTRAEAERRRQPSSASPVLVRADAHGPGPSPLDAPQTEAEINDTAPQRRSVRL
jgi:hypothetical protein